MEMLFTHERLTDFLQVEAELARHRMLMDACDVTGEQTYHLYNYYLHDEPLFCLLDRNIVSALVSLVRGVTVRPGDQGATLRLVAGLQAFLHAARITSDPGFAYHEYIESSGLDQADREMALFRGADNLDPNILLDIAVGLRSSVDPSDVPEFPSGELKAQVLPPKLKHFERNIVTVKKPLCIKAEGLDDYDVMLRLADWLFERYLFSAPTFVFLSVYFSNRRMSGMIKSTDRKFKRVRAACRPTCWPAQFRLRDEPVNLSGLAG